MMPLVPTIFLCGGAFLLLLWDVFIVNSKQQAAITVVSITGAIVSLFAVRASYDVGGTFFNGVLYCDPISWYFTLLILFGTLLALFLTMGRNLIQQGVSAPAEFYFLLLSATIGAIWLVSSAEFITLFLSLEILSMALYCLCGAAINNRQATESALKYFLLGSFASAFLLYGIALLYGATGTFSITELSATLQSADPSLIKLGLGFCLIGFLFKLGAVPFHFWAPDAYEGAPTSVTAYMACVVKASAVAVVLRVLWSAFGNVPEMWNAALWAVAVLTMVVGNVVAVRQDDVKRMLAYSSIAHAGYLLMPVLSFGGEFGGGGAALFYLVTYMVMTLGAFAVVQAVGTANTSSQTPHNIKNFVGLGKNSPWIAAAMTVFLLSLAGLPPGMAGLLGKFYVFSAAVKSQYIGLAIIAALCSAISCYYYLRIIVAMYFSGEGEKDAPEVTMSFSAAFATAICVVLVVVLGVFPTPVFTQATIVAGSF